MVERAEERAYEKATKALVTALGNTILEEQHKNALANEFSKMDSESSTIEAFSDAAICIVVQVREIAPELLPLALEALARAADYYKVYW